MRRALTGALVLAFLGILPAQDDSKAQPPTAKERMEGLRREISEYSKKWFEEQRAQAKKAADAEKENPKKEGESRMMPAMRMAPPLGDFAPKFEAAAKDYAGTEDAVPFLLWLVANGRETGVHEAALKTLLDTHVKSPQIGGVIGSLVALHRDAGDEGAAKLAATLARIHDENPSPEVKAAVLVARSQPIYADSAEGSEAFKKARAELEKAIELAPQSRAARSAKSAMLDREVLAVGKPAPEISGEDVDGVAFKLSDYRGKVVVLDFWGFW